MMAQKRQRSVLLFAASFPPPRIGGSVEYLFNIYKQFSGIRLYIHTGSKYCEQKLKMALFSNAKVFRSSYIHHPTEGHKRSGIRRALQYLIWPATAFLMILHLHPDIIHIGEANTAGLAALFFKLFAGIPYIHYVYAEELTLYKNQKLRYFLLINVLKNASGIISVSDYTSNKLVSLGIDPRKIHKLLPCVSDELRQPVSITYTTSTKLKYCKSDEVLLLSVGALRERKGHARILLALAEIKKRGLRFKYIIAGSGDQQEKLERDIAALSLSEDVVFLGRVDAEMLPLLYSACDIFLLATQTVVSTEDTEGCPTVFLEASSFGKPVIGGKTGGVADAIKEGVTGYIIEEGQGISLERHLESLITDQKLRDMLGQQGKEFTRNLTSENNGAFVISLGEELVRA